jgi:hypothetical protein
MAIRMSQRLEFPNPNGSQSKPSLFESQIRRRVWWQILWIDGRATQLTGLNYTYSDSSDFTLPENLNDADIYPYMTEIPSVHERATEMIFCLARYEVGYFLFNNGKKLHSPTTPISDRDRLIDELENLLTRKYLRYCNPAIPLHRIASGGVRSAICKMRLIAHHPSQYPDKGKSMPQSEHDMIFATSIEMVELHIMGFSDNELKSFSWHLDATFQLDTIVFMLIESHTQPPKAPLTEKAWDLVSEILKYRPEIIKDEKNELYSAVRQLLLNAWRARETEVRKRGLGQLTQSHIINTLIEMSERAKCGHEGTSTSISLTSTTEGSVLQNTPTVVAEGITSTDSGIWDSTEELIDRPTNADDSPFPDWDLTGLQSWEYWNDLLHTQIST